MQLRIKLVILFFISHQALGNISSGKSVILFIGDGMGYPQLDVTSLTLNGRKASLFTQQLSHQGEICTHSHSNEVTDSGAAATAMGTGRKTNNGSVGRDQKAVDIPNIFEIAKRAGLHTGIVTTVPVSHATPAGFASHGDSRKHTNRIIDQLLSRARPNILFGSAKEINKEWAEFKGYDVVSNREEMNQWQARGKNFHVSGQFGNSSLPPYKTSETDLPSLPEMTAKAIKALPQPFFLLVESGMIDWGGHEGDIATIVSEVQALDDAVQETFSWMRDQPNITMVVTADHETGGLVIDGPSPTKGYYPRHRFTAPLNNGGKYSHTAQKVPVYAAGSDAYRVEKLYDNTDLFYMMKDIILKNPKRRAPKSFLK